MAMLAEKRQKVQWVLNPRKTEWSSDSNKFGQRLLEQMGWKTGCGLGLNLQGSTEHVNVSVRSDNRGIGFKDRPEDILPHQSKFADLLAQLAEEEQPIDHVQEKKLSLESQSRQSRVRVHYHKFTRSKDISRYSQKDLDCILGKPNKAYKSIDVNADNSFIPSKTLWVKDVINLEENLHSSKKKQKCETSEEYLGDMVSSDHLKMVNENGVELQESSLTCVKKTKKGTNKRKRFEDSDEQQNSIDSDIFEPEEGSYIASKPSKKKQEKIKESSVTDNKLNSHEISEDSNIVLEENFLNPTETKKKKRSRSKEVIEGCRHVQHLKEEKNVKNSSTHIAKREKHRVKETIDECLCVTGCLEQQEVTNEISVLPDVAPPPDQVDALKKKKKKKKRKKCEELNEGSHIATLSDECVPVVKSSTDVQCENLDTESVDVLPKKKRRKNKHLIEDESTADNFSKSAIDSMSVKDSSLAVINIKDKKKKRSASNLVDVCDAKNHDYSTNSQDRNRNTEDNKNKQECEVFDTNTANCSELKERCKKSVRFSENCEVVFIPPVKKSNELLDNTSSVDKIEPGSIKSGLDDIKTQAQKHTIADTEYNVDGDQNQPAEQKNVSNICGRLQEEFPTDCATKTVAKKHKIILNGVKYVNGIATHLGRVPRRSSYELSSSKPIPYWQRKDITVDFPGANLVTLGYGYLKQS